MRLKDFILQACFSAGDKLDSKLWTRGGSEGGREGGIGEREMERSRGEGEGSPRSAEMRLTNQQKLLLYDMLQQSL